ncbi:MAG: hypothetical protein GVY12_02170 [Bacteroidetes bacterium]|jgi:hypothetical protein|nr:hypothetical protein [Bacteroidota bacterium]
MPAVSWIRCSLGLLLVGVLLAACGADTPDADADTSLSDAQEAFWDRLERLCGYAFEGEALEAPPGDDPFSERTLIAHVRQCMDDEIRIPFHVDENRSRTWIITKTESGLRLKHDHRNEDGSEEAITQYGGDTADAGTPGRQAFPADQETADMIPEASANVWTLEVDDEAYVYALRREGTDRRYRIRFDLTEAVDPPPAPWGYEDTEALSPDAPWNPDA